MSILYWNCLLFLPAYSPELQPAEHLWPLTNTVLANRHFATIDELEDTQAARCTAMSCRMCSPACRRPIIRCRVIAL